MVLIIIAGATGGLGQLMLRRLISEGTWHSTGDLITRLIIIDYFKNDQDRLAFHSATQSLIQEQHQKKITTASQNNNNNTSPATMTLDVFHWDAGSRASSIELEGKLGAAVGASKIEALIVTTGMGYHGALESTPIDKSHDVLDRLFRVNALGPSLVVQMVLKMMASSKNKKEGGDDGNNTRSLYNAEPPTILVMSSISGVIGLPLRSAYCASKFALNGFLESAYAEFRFARFVVICPSSVSTNFRDNWRRLLSANNKNETTTSPHEGDNKKKKAEAAAAVAANKADMTPQECIDRIWEIIASGGGPGAGGSLDFYPMPGLKPWLAMWTVRGTPVLGPWLRNFMLNRGGGRGESGKSKSKI